MGGKSFFPLPSSQPHSCTPQRQAVFIIHHFCGPFSNVLCIDKQIRMHYFHMFYANENISYIQANRMLLHFILLHVLFVCVCVCVCV